MLMCGFPCWIGDKAKAKPKKKQDCESACQLDSASSRELAKALASILSDALVDRPDDVIPTLKNRINVILGQQSQKLCCGISADDAAMAKFIMLNKLTGSPGLEFIDLYDFMCAALDSMVLTPCPK